MVALKFCKDTINFWVNKCFCSTARPIGSAMDVAHSGLHDLCPLSDRQKRSRTRSAPRRDGPQTYLFSKSESGAVDNAIYCSLLESCELAKVQPLQWQTHALENFGVEICYKERALLFGQGS